MTTEELDVKIDQLTDVVNLLKITVEGNEAGTTGAFHKLVVDIEELNLKVDRLAEVVKSLGEVVAANHAVCVGRLDVMDQLNVSVNGKIEALDIKVDGDSKRFEANKESVAVRLDNINVLVAGAVEALKRIEEMRGDIKLCKSAIRDLDSIRDSATRAANQVAGFEPRLSQMEESFAAFQTLRHDDDASEQPPAATADPAGAPGVDSMG